VAVLVNPSLSQAYRIAERMDVLQLHGKETTNFCRKLGEMSVRFWKAIPASGSHFATDTFYAERVILDAATNDGFGGTGVTFPWQWARQFIAAKRQPKGHPRRRANPENVAEAIKQVEPFGVDVTSGVEAVVGRKDIHKVRDFIAAARACAKRVILLARGSATGAKSGPDWSASCFRQFRTISKRIAMGTFTQNWSAEASHFLPPPLYRSVKRALRSH